MGKHLTDWLHNSIEHYSLTSEYDEGRLTSDFLERAVYLLNENNISKKSFMNEVSLNMQTLWQGVAYASNEEKLEILSNLKVRSLEISLSLDWGQFELDESNDNEFDDSTRHAFKREILRIGLIATGNYSIGQVVDLSKLTSNDVDGYEMLKCLVAVWFCLYQGDELCYGATPPLSKHLH